ncbi:MAG: GTP cyclohydrolase I [Bacillus sp. (in: firmicutes)]
MNRLIVKQNRKRNEDMSRKKMLKSFSNTYRNTFSGIGCPYIRTIKQPSIIELDKIIVMKNIPYFSISKTHSIYYWNLTLGFLQNEQLSDYSQIARLLEFIPQQIDNQESLINYIAERIIEIICLKGVIVRTKLVQDCSPIILDGEYRKNQTVVKGIFSLNQSLVDQFKHAL